LVPMESVEIVKLCVICHAYFEDPLELIDNVCFDCLLFMRNMHKSVVEDDKEVDWKKEGF
jgi:hypothetical protein